MMIDVGDLKWVAGFLEGEGCFIYGNNGYYIKANQVQKWPLIKLQNILGGHISLYRSKDLKKQDIYYWTVNGRFAAGITMTLYSLMSPKRQDQIKNALVKWRKISPRSQYSKVCRSGHPKIYPNWIKKADGRYHCKECERINSKHYYYTSKINRNPNQLRLQVGGTVA